MKPKICLHGIIKNEEDKVVRLLDSALPLITAAYFVDTCSTDNSVKLIEDYCTKHRLDYGIDRIPFVNFGQTRNAALVSCRNSGVAFDYILLADADHIFHGIWPEEQLTAPSYSLQITDGHCKYWRERLFKRDLPGEYIGVTHEYLNIPKEGRQQIASVYIEDRADGSNRTDKIDRDITLLEQGLLDEPGNARYLFYLARSYQDASIWVEAIATYEKRIKAGGWDEEIWHSVYQRSLCWLSLEDYASFVNGCWDAYNLRPWRAEPLYHLARWYRLNKQYDSCLAVCELGLTIPYPTQDVLFIENKVYANGFQEEQSIAGFYSKLPSRQKQGKKSCYKLSKKANPDKASRDLAKSNLKYYREV